MGVGFLNDFNGVQFLTGQIAEILVYDNASANTVSAATAYLDAKYFSIATPEPSSVVVWLLSGVTGLLVAGRRRKAWCDR